MTGLCVLRVEPQGSGSLLISVITSPDASAARTADIRHFTRTGDALNAVGSFLDGFESEPGGDPGT